MHNPAHEHHAEEPDAPEAEYTTVWTDPKDCWHTVRRYGKRNLSYYEVQGKSKVRIPPEKLVTLMGLVPDPTVSAEEPAQ